MEQRIVELRQEGYTWWQIDQLLFPGQVTKAQCYGGKSPSYKLAQKKQLPAFTKKVYGIYTHTQVVEKITLKPVQQSNIVGIFG